MRGCCCWGVAKARSVSVRLCALHRPKCKPLWKSSQKFFSIKNPHITNLRAILVKANAMSRPSPHPALDRPSPKMLAAGDAPTLDASQRETETMSSHQVLRNGAHVPSTYVPSTYVPSTIVNPASTGDFDLEERLNDERLREEMKHLAATNREL